MAKRERRDDAATAVDRTTLEGTSSRRRRAHRSPGTGQEIPSAVDAGEKPAAVRGRLERDRRHPQTGEGARRRGAQNDGGDRSAAERSESEAVWKRRSKGALGCGLRSVAALARRSSGRGREVEGTRRIHRE